MADRYILPGGFKLDNNTLPYYKVAYIDGKDGTLTNTVRRDSFYNNTVSAISVHNRTAFLCSFPYNYEKYKASIGYAITSGNEIGALSLIDLPSELDKVAYYYAIYDNIKGNYYFCGNRSDDGKGIYVVVGEKSKTYINHFEVNDSSDIINFKGAIGNNGILYICESSDNKQGNNVACYDTNTNIYKGKMTPKSKYSNNITIGTIVIDNKNDFLYVLILYNDSSSLITEIQKYDMSNNNIIESFTIDEQYFDGEAYIDVKRSRMYFACQNQKVVIVDLNYKLIVNSINIPAQSNIFNFIYSELWDSAFVLTFPEQTAPDAPIEVHIVRDINKTSSDGSVANI